MKFKIITAISVIFLASCSSGDGGGNNGGTSGSTAPTTAASVNQAAYVSPTNVYRFGHNSIANIAITGAPADTDYSRWAMAHSGDAYRLYFFQAGSSDTIYQFVFNGASYEWGFGTAISTLTITGAPADADSSHFAMVHDGTTYRLYLKSTADPTIMYQFGWNGASYAWGHNSIPQLMITDAPVDTDFSRWAMLHDGTRYRLYQGKQGTTTEFYQFAFNGSTYAYGFDSITPLMLEDTPADSYTFDFAMLHDGTDYRYY